MDRQNLPEGEIGVRFEGAGASGARLLQPVEVIEGIALYRWRAPSLPPAEVVSGYIRIAELSLCRGLDRMALGIVIPSADHQVSTGPGSCEVEARDEVPTPERLAIDLRSRSMILRHDLRGEL